MPKNWTPKSSTVWVVQNVVGISAKPTQYCYNFVAVKIPAAV